MKYAIFFVYAQSMYPQLHIVHFGMSLVRCVNTEHFYFIGFHGRGIDLLTFSAFIR